MLGANHKGLVASCVYAAMALTAACSGAVKEARTTTISSDPSGATVLASGVPIGVTPITVRPDDVFPPRFVGFEYRAAGTLSIEKPGCKTYRRQVNDAVLSEDVHVRLECDPNFESPQVEPSPASGTPEDGFAARLRRLQQLKQQGLITPSEYRQLRQKVLDQL